MSTLSKILVVDDIAANRRIIDFIISDLDIDLFFAASGEEALRLVQEHSFSVILMDIHMPTLNGIETARLIHSQPKCKDIPIIMITGSDRDSGLLMEVYEAGAVDFIIKPIEPTILLNKVSQFVELNKLYKQAEIARIQQAETNNKLQTLLNSAGEGIIGIDMSGYITFANPKAAAILLSTQDELCKTHVQTLFAPSSETRVSWETSKLKTFISTASGGHCDSEIWMRSSGEAFFVDYTNEPFMNNSEVVAGSVMIFQDISQRKAIEEKLTHLASYDPMTNLMNRGCFYDHLHKAIARARRSEISICILILDLDHFKYINDTYGHDTGDLLLKKVGEKLLSSVRTGDVVARMGGDEFGILLFDMKSIASIGPIVTKIMNNLAEDLELEGAKLSISCSIGVVQYDNFSMTMEEALNSADLALTEAKALGRNKFQLFIPNMHNEIIEKKRIQILLQRALPNNELSLVYQPKVCLRRKSAIGCEALLRWNPHGTESISPAKFIPIAEESGQIIEIGEWVIDQACKQAYAWHLQGIKNFSVSINVSTRQLRADNFFERFCSIFKHYPLPPSMIELEITETGTLENQTRVIKEIEKIHQLGVKIAIDDFGTGNSSLDYLRKFPLNTIKIDRSFVDKIGRQSKDEEIIRVILAVARAMDLDVVAEGAETEEQLLFLRENHCEIIQGYYFSKPLSTDEMTVVLQKAKTFFSDKLHSIDNHKYIKNTEHGTGAA